MSANKGKRSKMPPLTDIAADLRDGTDIADIAASVGVGVAYLAALLARHGWGRDGRAESEQPRPERIPIVGFLAGDVTWMDDALCTEIGPEHFFPEPAGASTVRARKVCADCPVREQCLEFALANNEAHGIWGGLMQTERAKLRKGRAA